jgi:hypothetical protein
LVPERAVTVPPTSYFVGSITVTFDAVPPVCVLYWKVQGDVPETYIASGFKVSFAKLIPKPCK